MNDKLNKIVEELKTLTLLEAAELVKEIEEVFGVDTSVSSWSCSNGCSCCSCRKR